MPRGKPGTKAPHGTITRYTRHGCRCESCKETRREYERRTRGHKPWALHVAAIRPEHGTESRYQSGCRCGECRSAASAARRRRRNMAIPHPAPLGWHVISGEDPDMVCAEEYANADHERIKDE